jgi:hypothetical protein
MRDEGGSGAWNISVATVMIDDIEKPINLAFNGPSRE